MHEYLFVYGTLRSGFSNPYAKKLRAEARMVGTATVRGSIFRIQDYPGFRPQPEGEVTGELYALENPAATLPAFDRYEGGEYERVLTRVSTGEAAWIYQFIGEPRESARIASGDFANQ